MGYLGRLKDQALDKYDDFRIRYKYIRGRRPSPYANTYNFTPSSESGSQRPWYRRFSWKKASSKSRTASGSERSTAEEQSTTSLQSGIQTLEPRRQERWPLD